MLSNKSTLAPSLASAYSFGISSLRLSRDQIENWLHIFLRLFASLSYCLTDPNIRLVVHVLGTDMAIEFRLTNSFPSWTRHWSSPPEGTNWRLNMLNTPKSKDAFARAGFLNVTPKHALLGESYRELPTLSHFDLSILVFADVICWRLISGFTFRSAVFGFWRFCALKWLTFGIWLVHNKLRGIRVPTRASSSWWISKLWYLFLFFNVCGIKRPLFFQYTLLCLFIDTTSLTLDHDAPYYRKD